MATWTLVPGQQYRLRLNTSTPVSTQGFAWRSVRVLAAPEDTGRGPRVLLDDLTDPSGACQKAPYVANIIQVEGQRPPAPASPAGGLAGACVGDAVTVDPLTADMSAARITRAHGPEVVVRPAIGGAVRRLLKNRVRRVYAQPTIGRRRR